MDHPSDPAPDRPIVLETDEARAGETPHVLRYILIVSLLLVIVAFGFVLWGAS